ncbi:hypothetical protein ABZ467_18080 [Streptomyces sp. NPDC005727]|uniref:hypothetical protein n=1 Tax=Streptomyces sp. NPDC005727 TaxID=3157053 RepID=UPI00340656E9
MTAPLAHLDMTGRHANVRKLIVGVCSGLLLIAVVVYFVVDNRSHSDTDSAKPQGRQGLPYLPGKPIPEQAARAAQDLAADDVQTQRAALTPEWEGALPPGRLLAKGSHLELRKNSWHEEGGYANAQAMLRKPGESAQRFLLAFAQRDGAWRITLAEGIK